MVVRPLLRRVLATLALYVVAALVIGYFAFHGWTGDHGLQAKRAFEVKMAALLNERAALQADRATWEKRVALLKPQSLDPDMLDERARDLLNWAHPNDVVVLRTPSAR